MVAGRWMVPSLKIMPFVVELARFQAKLKFPSWTECGKNVHRPNPCWTKNIWFKLFFRSWFCCLLVHGHIGSNQIKQNVEPITFFLKEKSLYLSEQSGCWVSGRKSVGYLIEQQLFKSVTNIYYHVHLIFDKEWALGALIPEGSVFAGRICGERLVESRDSEINSDTFIA